MVRIAIFSSSVVLALGMALGAGSGARGQTIDWIRQDNFGLPDEYESLRGITTDGAGNIYTAGRFGEGDVPVLDGGSPRQAVISRYTDAGDLLWTQTLGNPSYEDSFSAVATDPFGNAIAFGHTRGSLFGPNHGRFDVDVFVTKYQPDGALDWGVQLGAFGHDLAGGVTVDPLGNIYATGRTYGSNSPGLGGELIEDGWDAYIAKLDNNGAVQWIEQYGETRRDESEDIAPDGSGNVYIVGTQTDGSTTESDAFIYKVAPDGSLLWSKTIATVEEDDGEAIAIDSLGNVFVGGETKGVLGNDSFGDRDAFLQRYDTDGNLLWTTQFGTDEIDFLRGIVVDDYGRVVVAGDTNGVLGEQSAGEADTFVSVFDYEGSHLSTTQFGSDQDDRPWAGITSDGEHVYVGGSTKGDLAAPLVGTYDVFVAKLTVAPPPGDFNGDGAVDGADLLALQRQAAGPAAYEQWQANFGAPAAPAESVRAVPEPSGALALWAGGCTLLWRRRARRDSSRRR